VRIIKCSLISHSVPQIPHVF